MTTAPSPILDVLEEQLAHAQEHAPDGHVYLKTTHGPYWLRPGSLRVDRDARVLFCREPSKGHPGQETVFLLPINGITEIGFPADGAVATEPCVPMTADERDQRLQHLLVLIPLMIGTGLLVGAIRIWFSL